MVAWNALDKGPGITLSFSDLVASSPDPTLPGASAYFYNSGSFLTVRTDTGIAGPGKYYWEINALPRVIGQLIDIGIGISQKGSPPGSNPLEWPLMGMYTTVTAESRTVYRSISGRLIPSNAPYGPLFNSGTDNIIGCLLDFDNNQLSFQANGAILPVAAPMTPGATYYPMVTLTQGSVFANFGASSFTYPIPLGFQPYDNFALAGNSVGAFKRGRTETEQEMTEIAPVNRSTAGINKINNMIKSTAGKFKVGDDECAVCRTAINPNDIVQSDGDLDDKQSGRISG
jgi:hypothetical protein